MTTQRFCRPWPAGSSPLEGAGRVEDTINLLAHAARSVITCIAGLLDWSVDEVARIAGVPLLAKGSIKRALDREWSDPDQKAAAIVELVEHVDRLQAWIEKELPSHAAEPPLSEQLAMLRQIVQQDSEPDPSGGGRPRIRQGVAEDRRVSIADSDMRHGRKSKSKRFNGYKRHVAADLDSELILSCSVLPANRPQEEALPELVADIRCSPRGGDISELHIDRGYIASDTVRHVLQRGGEVLCKPWVPTQRQALHEGRLQARHAGDDDQLPRRTDGADHPGQQSSNSIRRSAPGALFAHTAPWPARALVAP